ncbi:MAG: FecR domain-containing protein [Bacteroidota bacterium]
MDLENKEKYLIRKYINKQCTADELEEVQELMLRPGVQHLFDEVLDERFIALTPQKDTEQQRLDQLLNKFNTRLQKPRVNINIAQPNEAKPVRFFQIKKYLPYAAVWALIVSGFFVYRFIAVKNESVIQRVAMREIVNPYGQRSKIILPDSSEVFLGAGSKLTIPEKFTGNLREISLQGEAFFQVTKNPKKPFIIHTGTVQTRVLGTSFKIEAFKNKPLTVAVVTGKVRVDDYTGNTHTSLAVLTPGQKVTYTNGQAIAGKAAIEDTRAWTDGRQVFNQQALNDITDVLERWYNIKIEYKTAKKAGEKISVILNADKPLTNIMKVLSATGHFEYAINGKTITIR